MATHAFPHSYQKLNLGFIRLLKLSSLPYSPTIEGDLVAFSVDALPKYTAISYTWGGSDPTDRLQIKCSGSYVPLPSSAAYILLRAPRFRWLWIDTVCIDQRDNDDKTQQVSMMWAIYSHAALVMVWLGDLADDADLALAFVRQWDSRAAHALAGQDENFFGSAEVQRFWDAFDAMRWKALYKLLQRPWFRRSWIVQEVSTPRKIVVTCGGKVTASWENMSRAAQEIRASPALCRKLLHAGGIAEHYRIEQVPRQFARIAVITFGDLLERTRSTTSHTATLVDNSTNNPPLVETSHSKKREWRLPKRFWIPAHDTEHCSRCKSGLMAPHETAEKRSSRLKIALDIFADSPRGVHEYSDQVVAAEIIECILRGGFDGSSQSPTRLWQRSRALQRVINAGIWVDGWGSHDLFRSSLPPALDAIHQISTIQSIRGKNGFSTLQENLLRTADFLSSDARDKIYAVLSYSFQGRGGGPRADYHSSLAEVYLKTTADFVMADLELFCLHLAGIGWPRSIEGLPSWVPDYTQAHRRRFRRGTLMILGRATSWSDERSTFACWSFRMGDMPANTSRNYFTAKSIGIHGIIVDSIRLVLPPPMLKQGFLATAVCGSASEQNELKQWFSKLEKLFIHGHSAKAKYSPPYQRRGNALSRKIALWNVLTARTAEGRKSRRFLQSDDAVSIPQSPFPLIRKMEALFLYLVEGYLDSAENMHPSVFIQRMTSLMDEFCLDLDAFSDWCIFETKQGFIGRGPSSVAVGNQICAFQGLRTPFVIETVGAMWFPLGYRLVGEAYVEGLMSREAEFLAERRPLKAGRIWLV